EASMKSGDKVRLSTLRLLYAAAKNREVEVLHELSDAEFQEHATQEPKRRTEANEASESARHEQLDSREQQQRDVQPACLPPERSTSIRSRSPTGSREPPFPSSSGSARLRRRPPAPDCCSCTRRASPPSLPEPRPGRCCRWTSDIPTSSPRRTCVRTWPAGR